MQQIKNSILALLLTTLTAAVLPDVARSQSGRGRPKVPQPSATTPPPAPVTVPAATAVVKQEQVGSTSRFLLRNGITVIISEQHATPIAASVAYFKAGALDEPDSMMGLTRTLGQLILKGSAGRAVTSLRALGGIADADVTYDGTSQYVIIPSDKINAALSLQAGMIQNPSFDADDIARSLTISIEEEQAVTSLDPSRYGAARLASLAFSGQALGRFRPIGAEALRSATREQVSEFYRTHFKPENLVVSVVGDVSTFATLVQIQQVYAGFATAPAAARIVPANTHSKSPAQDKQAHGAQQPGKPEPDAAADKQQAADKGQPADRPQAVDRPQAEAAQPALRYAADRTDISQSIASIGFRVPGFDSKEWPAIEVLASLIARGRASRLHRSLVDGQAVASRVESSYAALADKGLLAVQVWVAAPGTSIDKAESGLFRELDLVRREIPAEVEMTRAKTVLEKEFLDHFDTYVNRAKTLARAESLQGSFRAALDYRNQIRAVRAEDVQRAAAKYLTLSNTFVYEQEPLSAEARTFDSAAFAATVTAWAPAFALPVGENQARPADPNSSATPVTQGAERAAERQSMIESVQPLPVKDFSTLNGPRAFVREDHSQPQVTIALLFQGGRAVEDESTSGTTELMLRSMLYGTARRTPAEVAQALDQLGAEVETVTEPDFFGFTLSVLSRNADRALKLLRDLIEDPAFRDEDINHARVAQIGRIRGGRDSSLLRSRELMYQSLFAGHPYSFPAHGREEAIAKLTSEQLSAWHERVVKRQMPLAIIVGDTDGSALVSAALAEGFRRRELDSVIQMKVPQPKAGEKSEQRRRDQTVAFIGFAGPKSDSPDLTIVEVIEAATNLAGGRFRQNLTFAAGLENEALFAAGTISAYAITSPENEQRARAALLAEIDRLARAGVNADELASARTVADTLKTARLQSQEARALEYARAIIYQHKPSDVDSFGEQASKVTADDVKRVASTYFKPPAASAGIVRGTPPAPQAPSKQEND